jgi:hypothetical protein
MVLQAAPQKFNTFNTFNIFNTFDMVEHGDGEGRRRPSDTVILPIPGDEPGDPFFDRSRWREANIAL